MRYMIYVSIGLKQHKMPFPFALAGCMLMGILGVGLWQAGGGLHAGTLEEMEVRWTGCRVEQGRF